MSTLVLHVEHAAGAARRARLEAIGAAHSAGAETLAVLAGDGAAEAAATCGATNAIVLTGDSVNSPDAVACTLAAIVKETGAAGFLAAATSIGKDIAPRVAAQADVALGTAVALPTLGIGLEWLRFGSLFCRRVGVSFADFERAALHRTLRGVPGH